MKTTSTALETSLLEPILWGTSLWSLHKALEMIRSQLLGPAVQNFLIVSVSEMASQLSINNMLVYLDNVPQTTKRVIIVYLA